MALALELNLTASIDGHILTLHDVKIAKYSSFFGTLSGPVFNTKIRFRDLHCSQYYKTRREYIIDDRPARHIYIGESCKFLNYPAFMPDKKIVLYIEADSILKEMYGYIKGDCLDGCKFEFKRVPVTPYMAICQIMAPETKIESSPKHSLDHILSDEQPIATSTSSTSSLSSSTSLSSSSSTSSSSSSSSTSLSPSSTSLSPAQLSDATNNNGQLYWHHIPPIPATRKRKSFRDIQTDKEIIEDLKNRMKRKRIELYIEDMTHVLKKRRMELEIMNIERELRMKRLNDPMNSYIGDV